MAQLDYQYIEGLVEQVQQGDSNAFAELYAATYQKQYFAAYKYLRDDFLAQDALQETYITALKNINSLRDAKLFISWLNQINFHTCYDMCKKLNSQYGVVDSDQLELTRDDNIEHNPEDVYERNDEVRKLREAIDRLPFLEKQVIVLRYYNDMKLEEIAKALSISRSTVKRYLQSAKEKLKNF